MSVRTTRQVSLGPLTTSSSTGDRVMKADQVGEERLADVLLVVPSGQVGVDVAQLGGNQASGLCVRGG